MEVIKRHYKFICSGGLLLLLFACSSPAEYDHALTWSPVEIGSDIEDSEQVEAMIAPYRLRLDSIMNEVIGYAAYDLNTQGQYESTLGTFVTELTLTQSIAVYDQPVDVAIMNHKGGLRAPINEGPITLGEVFQVMPFENAVILLEVPGNTLIEVVEYIGRSGRSMIWPVSYEVTDEGLKNIRVNGQKVEPNKNYILSVTDYLADGGGGFRMLIPLKRIPIKPVLHRDMIANEIRQRTAKGDSIKAEVANLVTLSNQ